MKSTLKIILLLSLLFFALEQFFFGTGNYSMHSKAEITHSQAATAVSPGH